MQIPFPSQVCWRSWLLHYRQKVFLQRVEGYFEALSNFDLSDFRQLILPYCPGCPMVGLICQPQRGEQTGRLGGNHT